MENSAPPIRILIIAANSTKTDLEHYLGAKEKFQIISSTDSGQEGIDIARVEKPDVVFIAVNITDMNALEVLQAIKGICPNSKFILTTRSNDPNRLRKALVLGADMFINEPIDQDETINCINYVLKKNQGSDQS